MPVAAYGIVLFCSGCAYFILAKLLVGIHGRDSVLGRAIGADRKGVASVVLYAAAIGFAFVRPPIALALYVTVAILWLVPDRRIENILTSTDDEPTD